MLVIEYVAEHAVILLSIETCVMFAFSATFPCGIFQSGLNMNLVGCSALHVEVFAQNSFLF